jgi:peptidoglycan/xylan/chitin deacetylase (PgdA/CDA1 family)
MSFPRLTAVGALVVAVLVAAVVTLRSDAPDDARSNAPTATATATLKKERPKKRKAGAAPVVGEITGAKARRMAVPILMYHVISKAPAGVANAELWVDKDVFADEMHALQSAGYTAITLQQAWDGWKQGGPMPRKPVVISFDDGYLSHYTHAKPVLRKLGWPGVLYLTVKNIGPGGLTERQIRSLMKAGWEIDSHTLTHPDLTTLDDATLARELEESRAELKQRFDVPVNFFAYPAGRYDARVQQATRAAGYLAATTVEEGFARRRDDPFALKRVRVNATDTADSLLAKLSAH